MGDTVDVFSRGRPIPLSVIPDPANPGQYLLQTSDSGQDTTNSRLGTPGTGEPAHAGGSTGLIGWARDIVAKIAAFGTSAAPSADVLSVQYPNTYVGKATLAALNAALTVDTLGASQMQFYCALVAASSSCIIEGTNSNETTPTWRALRSLYAGTSGPVYSSPGAQFVNVGTVLLVDCAGMTQVRFRVATYGTGPWEVLAHRSYCPALRAVVNEPSNTSSNPLSVSAVSQINGYATTAYGSQLSDTIAPLASGAIFTSSARNSLSGSVGSYTIDSISDQASASNGVKIQRSSNASNWYDVWIGSATANTPIQQKVWVTAPYMRFTYTNGATLQGSFSVSSALRIN